MKLLTCWEVLLFITVFTGICSAQLPDVSSLPGMDSTKSFSLSKFAEDAVKISGDIGMNGDLYSVSGKQSSRPGGTGRMFFRPTIAILDKVTLNFDFFLSTEGNSARQSINTAKFNPEWSWGKIYFGDFTMEMSKFTLTDVNIRGYGFDIYPGIFKIQGFTGKSQKAVVADASSSMYERQIYGGKIGIGELSGAHIHLNFLRAQDKLGSVPRDIFRRIDTVNTSAGARIDTNYTGVTPQENLISGLNWGFSLFDNSLKMKGEVALSILTKDMHSPIVNSKDVPSTVSKFFTPRLTSSGDVAYAGEMAYVDREMQLRGGYTFVGPGYTSLGMGSLINDRQIITGGAGFTFLQGDLVVQTNTQLFSDNVAKQKRYTTDRNNYAFSVSVRPVNALMLSLNTNINTISNSATNDTFKVSMNSAAVGLTSNYMFEAFSYKHVLNAGVTTQSSESRTGIRGSSLMSSQNLNLGVATAISKQTSASVTMAFGFMDMGVSGKANTQSYAGRVNQKMLDDKMTNSFSYNLVNSSNSLSHVLSFQSSYQVFQSSAIVFNTRGTFFRGKGPSKIKFSEYLTTIDWSYRF